MSKCGIKKFLTTSTKRFPYKIRRSNGLVNDNKVADRQTDGLTQPPHKVFSFTS
jgi:hypothetical protein